MYARTRKLAILICGLLGGLLLCSTAAAFADGKSSGTPGLEALDYGFRFASAIHADKKDMGKAQERVVLDFANVGALDRAMQLSDQIEGWRRGSVYANLSSMLVDEGRQEDARAFLRKAQSYQQTVEGWQNKRVAAHIAHAHARLGNVDETQRIATDISQNDPRQYTGRSIATVASVAATIGEFDKALTHLSQLDSAEDFDIVWWRTLGYLELARRQDLKPEQRRLALDRARKSADGVPGWKQAEALEMLAVEYLAQGRREPGLECLELAEKIVRSLPDTMIVRAALMSTVARAIGEYGEVDRARRLLAAAEEGVPRTLNIDRPDNYGAVAAGYYAIGAESEALRVFDKALDEAAGLVNARPRALAIVAICRWMGRHEFELTDAVRTRLDDLFAGLRDPW